MSVIAVLVGVLFAAGNGVTAAEPAQEMIELCAIAADCLSRAIARGVYAASIPGQSWSGPPAWRDKFTPST